MVVEANYSESGYCPGRFVKCTTACMLWNKEEQDCAYNLQAKYSKLSVILLETIADKLPIVLSIEGVDTTVEGEGQ